MANVNFMTLAVWRLFRCQAYDKKVRWTFFSYIAGNVKLSIFDIILTQIDEKVCFLTINRIIYRKLRKIVK